MKLTMFAVAAVALLLGCGEQATKDVTAPQVVAIPSSEEGALLRALDAMGEDTRGKHSVAEWLASPAGQMFLNGGLKHIEDMAVGIDDGMGPSPPAPPDSGEGGAD